MSQKEFAKILGVKAPTVCRYESGRIPDEETLKKIADFGGVSVEWLLIGEKLEVLDRAGGILLKNYLGPGVDWEEKDSLIVDLYEAGRSQRKDRLLKDLEIERLQEHAPEAYEARPLPPLDFPLLVEVIRVVEEFLAGRRPKRRPIQKARLIAFVYEHCAENKEQPGADLVARYLTLAD